MARYTDNLEMMVKARRYNNFLLSLIRKYTKQDCTVIDFGSGIGIFARELHGNGVHISCVEPDPTHAAIAAAAGLPVSRSLDDIQDMSVDYIYALNVLEHIEDDEATLMKIWSKLKPDGVLLVYVPAFQILYSSMDRKVGHFRRYTKRALLEKLRKVGFHVMNARYADSLGFFVSLLFRFLGNNTGSLNRLGLILYDRIIFPISKICDVLFSSFLGKNIIVVARR